MKKYCKQHWKRGLALLLAVALVAGGSIYDASSALKATDGGVEEASTPEPETAVEEVEVTDSTSYSETDEGKPAEEAEEPSEADSQEEPEEVSGVETPDAETDADADNGASEENTEEVPNETEDNAEAEEPTEEEVLEELPMEEEVSMPAQHFEKTAGNGVTVTVDAPEGAFPEGTTMTVAAVSDSKAKEVAEGSLSEAETAVDAKGVDITFYYNGEEIQPETAISVNLSLKDALDGDSFKVCHEDHNGDSEVIANAAEDGGSFSAENFSIYVVAGTTVEKDEGQLAVTISYVDEDGAMVKNPDTVVIDEEDGNFELSETVEFPEEYAAGYSIEVKSGSATVTYNEGYGTFTVAATFTAEEYKDAESKSAAIELLFKAKEVSYYVISDFDDDEAGTKTITQKETGRVGQMTEVVAEEISGYTAEEIEQKRIEANGNTTVYIHYVSNTYMIIYDTQGGSYVKPQKNLKYNQEATVYSAKESTELTCDKKAHTHTAMPTSNAGDWSNQDQTIGCYTSTKTGTVWNSWSWVLSCEYDEEHTHSDACNTTIVTYDPAPTRTGYTFDGWYLDEACTKKASATVIITGNMTVYAKWIEAEVKYTVVYMAEVYNDSDTKTYAFDHSEVKTAKVGDYVQGGESAETIAYHEYKTNDKEKEVKADGTTVVTSYYDLIEYTIQFYMYAKGDDDNQKKKTGYIYVNGVRQDNNNYISAYTINAKIGQDISDIWPVSEKKEGAVYIAKCDSGQYSLRGWKDKNDNSDNSQVAVTKRFELTGEMVKNASNNVVTYEVRWTDETSKKTVEYYLQNPTTESYDYSEKYSETVISTNTMNPKEIYGYSYIKTEKSGDTYKFYYNLNSYVIKFCNKDSEDLLKTTEKIFFGADISGYYYTPVTPEGLDGYTFGGWYDNVGCEGDAYVFGTMPDNNLELYAKWIAPTETVTLHYNYNDDETSVEKTSEIEVAEGSCISDENVLSPEREGYVFEGWYTDKDCTEEFDIDEPINEDTTLYAKWTQITATTYTVIYIIKGENGETTSEIVKAPIKGTIGKTVTAKAEAKEGLLVEDGQTSKSITLEFDPEKNVITFTYVPATELKYTVQYVLEDDTSKVVNEYKDLVAPGQSFNLYPSAEAKTWLSDNGYELVDGSKKLVSLSTKSADNVFKFEVKLIEYSIEYRHILVDENSNKIGDVDENDVTYSSVNPTSYTIQSDDLSITNPTYPGYEFMGWDYNEEDGVYVKEGSDQHNPNSVVVATGSHADLVFTGKWCAKTYTVEYDVNGGAETYPNKEKVKWNDANLIPETDPTRDGYNFCGWYYGNTKVLKTTKYKDLAGQDTVKEITLVAKWERNDEYAVTVTPYTGIYDGEAHGVTVTGLAEGDVVYYAVDGEEEKQAENRVTPVTRTDVKRGENNTVEPYNVSIRVMNGGEEVSVTGNAYILINPRPITFTSADDEKVYDGKPLKNDKVTVGGDGFATGEDTDITYNVTGSQTDVGSSENTFTVNWPENTEEENTKESNYDVTTKYGTLTVTKSAEAIIIKANDLDKIYDGNPLEAKGATYKSVDMAGLADDHTLYVTVSGSQTDVGTGTSHVERYWVEDERGKDVTGNYSFAEPEDGKLTVTPRNVTLTSETASKKYDGTPLTAETVTVSEDGFAEGEGAVYEVTGSQLEAGRSNNTFSYKLEEGTKEGNYNITKVEGTLTVTKVEQGIVLKAKDLEKMYDGTALTAGSSDYEFSSGELMKGDTLIVEVSGSRTDAGTSESKIESIKIINSDGKTDVTASYTVDYSGKGTIEVTKRPVTLTSATASKTYDGSALTDHGVTVGGSGFVDGQGATYDVTGSQLAAGESKNIFTYMLNEGTNPDNYEITQKEGTLTVKPITNNAIQITAKSDSKTYDGKPLTNNGYFYTAGVLVEGDELTAVVEGKITDVGIASNVVTSYQVIHGNTDVTKSYTFENSVPGTLTVNQRNVTLTSATDTKVYDGKPLTNDTITVGGDGFVDGEGATYDVTGTQTDVGTSSNTFTYTLNDSTKAKNYNITKGEGTLTVRASEEEIIITAPSDSKIYDGTPLTQAKGATYTGGILVDGDVLYVTVEGSRTDAGESANKVKSWRVMRGGENGTDVTNNYKFGTPIDGNLTVTKRPVTLTSATDEKIYDGQPLEKKVVTDDGFVTGEGATYNVTGSRTIAGTSENEFTYVLNANTKEENYEITKSVGKLIVTRRTVTVTADNKTKAYDNNHKTPELTATISDVVDGEEGLIEYTLTREPCDELVGVYENAIKASGEQVQGNYTVSYAPGTLTITDEEIDGNVVDEIVKKDHETGNFKLGDTVAFTITATNIYSETKTVTITENKDGVKLKADTVTINGASATDGQVTVTENQAVISDVKAGAVVKIEASYTVTEADISSQNIDNSATVSYSGGKDFTDDDEVEEKEIDDRNAHLTVSKDVINRQDIYKLGDTITWKITVKNDGNITINDVKVEDELTGNTKGFLGLKIFGESRLEVGTLKPGDSKEFKVSYTVTEADLVNGTVINVATASGKADDRGEEPETEDGESTVVVAEQNPSIEVLKKSDVPEGTKVRAGDKITYTITVTNNGNATVSGITVEDPLTGAEWGNITLVPKELADPENNLYYIWTGTTTYTVTETDVLHGEVANTATASGDYKPNNSENPAGSVKDDDTITNKTVNANAHATITKKLADGEKPEAEDGKYVLGEEITYTITVTNDGNQTLKNVVITDELTGNIGDDAEKIAELAVGESKYFNVNYVVTEKDILAGKIVNVATGTADKVDDPDDGKDPIDPTIEKGEETIGSDEDDPDNPDDPDAPNPKYDIEDVNPHLTVMKTLKNGEAPENGEAYVLGEFIDYVIVAKNDGNQTLTNVVVTDVLTGDEWTIETLGVGASKEFETQYQVTAEDIKGGSKVINVATAEADPIVPDDSEDPVKPEVEPGQIEKPTVKPVTLTIHYVNTAGTALANDYTKLYAPGETFSIASPAISGYTASVASVAGTMGEEDLEYTVTYTATTTAEEGGGGSTDNDDDDNDEPTPSGTILPVMPVDEDVIPDGTAPAAGATAPAAEAEDLATLEEDDVPMAALVTPNEDGGYDIEEIPEEDVPLIDLGLEDVAFCILHLLIMMAALLIQILYMSRRKRLQADIFELREQIEGRSER